MAHNLWRNLLCQQPNKLRSDLRIPCKHCWDYDQFLFILWKKSTAPEVKLRVWRFSVHVYMLDFVLNYLHGQIPVKLNTILISNSSFCHSKANSHLKFIIALPISQPCGQPKMKSANVVVNTICELFSLIFSSYFCTLSIIYLQNNGVPLCSILRLLVTDTLMYWPLALLFPVWSTIVQNYLKR